MRCDGGGGQYKAAGEGIVVVSPPRVGSSHARAESGDEWFRWCPRMDGGSTRGRPVEELGSRIEVAGHSMGGDDSEADK
jgi:hypothetical protein